MTCIAAASAPASAKQTTSVRLGEAFAFIPGPSARRRTQSAQDTSHSYSYSYRLYYSPSNPFCTRPAPRVARHLDFTPSTCRADEDADADAREGTCKEWWSREEVARTAITIACWAALVILLSLVIRSREVKVVIKAGMAVHEYRSSGHLEGIWDAERLAR